MFYFYFKNITLYFFHYWRSPRVLLGSVCVVYVVYVAAGYSAAASSVSAVLPFLLHNMKIVRTPAKYRRVD